MRTRAGDEADARPAYQMSLPSRGYRVNRKPDEAMPEAVAEAAG